jgi:glycosyltransferase involved in cell wall biosynthesis
MNTLISIIIPTYNRASMLDAVLNSIHEQSYTNWECLVVDDGSTDTSKETVRQWIARDPRIKWLERPSSKKKGANACRNFGLEKSQGSYINWFDSDDLFLTTKLEKQVSRLEDTDYECCICMTERYDAVQKKSFGLRAEGITSDDILNDYIQFNIFWTTGAPLWRKSFLLENNLTWDEDLQQSQDYDFHIRAISTSTHYCTIDEVLEQIVRHEQNMSNAVLDSHDKILSNVKVRFKALKFQHQLLNDASKRELFNKMFYFFRTATLQGNVKTSKAVFRFLKESKPFVEKSISFEKGIFNRWKFGMLLYNLTGKGERFLKPNKA